MAQHRFPIRFVSFFVSSSCVLVRVTMVDKNKAVVCCLLATSVVMLSESVVMLSEKKKRKGKMWSKKWYFEKEYIMRCSSAEWIARNGCWRLYELVPWDDVIVVSAAKLRKLWDSVSEMRSSLFERRLERTVLRPALLPVKTAHFTQFFVRYDFTQ